MNYILEIKAFYDRLELNPLPSPAIALWHALMHIANKTGWQQEFTVAVSILSLKTGLNAQAIKRARNLLQQQELIEWKARNGNQSAIYKMIPLWYKTYSDFVPQNEPENVPQNEPENEPINKQKQKQTKKESNTKVLPKKKFIPPTLEEVRAYCEERKNKINPEQFIDFYTAKNWMIGKNKMKDWKAAIRTWERNQKSKGKIETDHSVKGEKANEPRRNDTKNSEGFTEYALKHGLNTEFEGF